MFGTIGWQEILLVFLVVLLLFGAKRLPEVGKSFGKGLKEFRKRG
ncbi:twin-arginine translocase TatA/TatE family subunit [candidate division TA06 bacterium]|uniref:Twin-arginine translocase TatA/TatE family subunit n=1 Tax=candidate division TA06 bacterium TaxID=2250710 RepID=A0A523XQ19_UNCT6|nr:MAG: twin-arginine translocase TatA/TatE family subunit [candidate division TA06 bacterium]